MTPTTMCDYRLDIEMEKIKNISEISEAIQKFDYGLQSSNNIVLIFNFYNFGNYTEAMNKNILALGKYTLCTDKGIYCL